MPGTGSNPTSVKKNLLYSVLYTSLNIGFPIVSFAYVARILGPEVLGRLNFTLAMTAFFVLAAALAMPLYGAREIALARDDQKRLEAVFSELFTLNAITTVLSSVFFAALFMLSSRMQQDWVLFAITGSSILFNLFSVEWFFQGLENYRFILWRNLLFKTASLALLFALVHGRNDVFYVAAIGVFSSAGNNFMGFLSAFRRAPIRPCGPGRLKQHIRPMGIIAGSTLSASTYVFLDSVLLGYLSGNAAVGFFTAATRVPKVAISVLQSLTAVIIPRFSWYMHNGKMEEYRAMARKSLSLIYMFAFPITGALLVLAPRIIRLLSGPGYEAAIPAMRITAPLVILMGFTNFLSLQIIFPNKGEAKLLRATLTSATICLVLNFLLIPRFTQNGTAIALIAAECGSALVQIILAGKNGLDFGFFDRIFFRYAALSILSTAIIHYVSGLATADLPAIAFSMAAGGAAYFLALLGSKDALAREILGLATANIGRILKSA